MGASVLVIGCVVLIGAAALVPLRRALFIGSLVLVASGYGVRRALGGGSLGALTPLSATCAVLLVLLIRHLAEQRRQASRLVVAERAAACARAEAAADGERTRIARDLHDGLAHNLSGLLLEVQTAQAMLSDGDTGLAMRRMGSSVELARKCLVEARDVVGVLRTGEADLGLMRAITDNWAQVTGRSVALTLPGSPVQLDGTRWSVAAAALREALTNISRHSTSREVAVEVSVSDEGLRLTVTDTRPDPAVIRATGEGGGHGLTGLRERAALLRGELSSCPHGDGWQLRLSLPAAPSLSLPSTRYASDRAEHRLGLLGSKR